MKGKITMKNKRKALAHPGDAADYKYETVRNEIEKDDSNWFPHRDKKEYANSEAFKLMNEIGEKLNDLDSYESSNEALKDYSREQLERALREYDSQWGFLDYLHGYETDYWLNFACDLIEAGKIEPDYWADRMPQSNPYPELIKVLGKRMKHKHLNLSEKELAEAFYQAKLGKLDDAGSDILDCIQSDRDKIAELNKLLAVSYPDIKTKSKESGTVIAKNLRAMLKSTPDVVKELRRTTQKEVTE